MLRTTDRANARPSQPAPSTYCSDGPPSTIPSALPPNSQRSSMPRGHPRRDPPATKAVGSTLEGRQRFGRVNALFLAWFRRRLRIRRTPIPARQRLRFAAVFPRPANSGTRWTGRSSVPVGPGPVPKVPRRRTAQRGAGPRVSVARTSRVSKPESLRYPLAPTRSSSSGFPSNAWPAPRQVAALR